MSSYINKHEIAYQVEGFYTQDQWFFRKDEWIYFYHLLMPLSAGDTGRWGTERIAVSRSKDLLNWEYLGWAFESINPDAWDGKYMATGSTVEYQGKFWMFYCGYSWQENCSGGIGLAISDDLANWERVSDKPVIDFSRSCYNPAGPFADPYVFFHERDKCFYMLGTLGMAGEPAETAGCISLAKSIDLFNWEILPPLIFPRIGSRIEVPQVWEHNGKWYLMFCLHSGGLQSSKFTEFLRPLEHCASYVMTADNFMGPYEFKGRWWILPNMDCYTCRVITDTKGILGFDGGHALMTWRSDYDDTKCCVRAGATQPWHVTYPQNGGLLVE